MRLVVRKTYVGKPLLGKVKRRHKICHVSLKPTSPDEGLRHLLDGNAIVAAARAAGFEADYWETALSIELPAENATKNTAAVLEQINAIILAYAGEHAGGPVVFVDELDFANFKDPVADVLRIQATYMGYEMGCWNLEVEGWNGRLNGVLHLDDARRALIAVGYEIVSWGNDMSILARTPGWYGRGASTEDGLAMTALVEPYLRVRQGALDPVIYV